MYDVLVPLLPGVEYRFDGGRLKIPREIPPCIGEIGRGPIAELVLKHVEVARVFCERYINDQPNPNIIDPKIETKIESTESKNLMIDL